MNYVNRIKNTILVLIFIFSIVSKLFAADVLYSYDKMQVNFSILDVEADIREQLGAMPYGKIIKFGHYEQDNNPNNGKEPVEWIVVDVDEKEHVLTLISLYLLDCLRFETVDIDSTWENSFLRQYLNYDMMSKMFTPIEMECIKLSPVINLPNPYYNIPSGNITEDYLYIPSIDDIAKYLSPKDPNGKPLYDEMLLPNELRMAIATDYAIAQGVRVNPPTHKFAKRGNYFLRTTGLPGPRIWFDDVEAMNFQSYVTELGEVKPDGTGINSCDDGIRLMMKVHF